jgi:hypothetical protein
MKRHRWIARRGTTTTTGTARACGRLDPGRRRHGPARGSRAGYVFNVDNMIGVSGGIVQRKVLELLSQHLLDAYGVVFQGARLVEILDGETAGRARASVA